MFHWDPVPNFLLFSDIATAVKYPVSIHKTPASAPENETELTVWYSWDRGVSIDTPTKIYSPILDSDKFFRPQVPWNHGVFICWLHISTHRSSTESKNYRVWIFWPGDREVY